MELGLSLGVDCNSSSNTVSSTAKPFGFYTNHGPDPGHHPGEKNKGIEDSGLGLGFCMALAANPNDSQNVENHADAENNNDDDDNEDDDDRTSSEHTRDDPLQLDLLPRAPVPRRAQLRRRWSSENGSSGSSGAPARGFDVSRLLPAGGVAEEVSSPNSVPSSFQVDLSIFSGSGGGGNLVKGGNKRDLAGGAGPNDLMELERGSSRASDEDENGLNGRKKLRLTKEQSAYLEESFKEHSTLNPKQKLALAKQLNLRPRQVEVWFQNRRARTKLKQTEVDCEYLKRCCETLTEENRRLHKELQELRALKTNNPFYMQLPATTLTMCPSCERVATTSTAPPSSAAANPPTSTTATFPSPPTATAALTTTTTTAADSIPKAIPFPITTSPMFCTLAQPTNQPHQSAAS